MTKYLIQSEFLVKHLLIFTTLLFSFIKLNAQKQSDTLTIFYLTQKAELAITEKKFEDAKMLASKALDSSEIVGYNLGKGRSLYLLGLAHQQTSNPALAISFYMLAVPLAQENPSLLSNILRNYGNSHNDLGNFDSAIYYQSKVLEMNTKLGRKTEMARALNNLGITYSSIGEYPKALEYLFKSLLLKEELKDKKGMASTLNNIGVVFQYQGDAPKAIDYFQKALTIREELKDLQSAASIYNNIGIIYREENRFDDALEYYKRAQKIYESIDNKKGVSATLHNQAIVLFSNGKNEEALNLFELCLKIDNEIGFKEGIPNVLLNMAKVHTKMGKDGLAQETLDQALAVAKELGDKRQVAIILIEQSKGFLRSKAYGKGVKLANDALAIANELELLPEKQSAHEILWQIHEKLGEFGMALSHHKNFILFRDSLNSVDRTKKIFQVQKQAEFDKQLETQRIEQAKQIEIAELQGKRQRVIAFSFMLVSFLLLGLAMFIYYHYRSIQKQNTILTYQKQEIEQHQEEITAQRDEIESQKNLVMMQRDRILGLFSEISENIMYAQRMQQALLPTAEYFDSFFSDHFAYLKPKQFVSGDFYWAKYVQKRLILAVADCTGHSIPGGFMSILGITLLNELSLKSDNALPNLLLNDLRDKIISSLKQTGQDVDNMDGMDIALITFNPESLMLTYSGANNPVWIARKSGKADKSIDIIELKPDRMPISYHFHMEPFNLQTIQLQKGDMIYMFSDGFCDQFGGQEGKKFQYSNFRSLLKSVAPFPTEYQKNVIDKKFTTWQGSLQQVDDVLVFGFRV